MNRLSRGHSSCACSGTLPVPFSDLDKWLLTKGYSGTELLFKKALTWPHTVQSETLLHEAFITHTFQNCCTAHRTSELITLSGPLFQSPQSYCFHLLLGKTGFFSTTCLLVSDLHHEEEWSSTNPHPNSQTFLNPKQESQACDKKHYSCPHLLFNIPAPQLFSYPLVLFAKWFQSELMTFIIIYYVHKFQRYDPLVLHLSES